MIAYFDTSMLVKLLVDDEAYRPAAERIWLDADHVVCAEIGYVEARVALAAAQRSSRLDAPKMQTAKDQFEALWEQVSVVAVDTALVQAAGDIAELDGLRGYDAVHLAAAVAARATVVASADRRLVGAARNRGFGVAQPR
ncbi:MAG: type II toxin-antitoxin system VapC family toxin [Nakamurella sp.]